jgi:alpha-galactosidase
MDLSQHASLLTTLLFCAFAGPPAAGDPASIACSIEGKNLRIEFDGLLHSRVVARLDGKDVILGAFTASEFINAGGNKIKDFTLADQRHETVQDNFGSGQRLWITGTAGALKKTVSVTIYDEFQRMAFFEVQYTNTGDSELAVNGWTNQHYSISAAADAGDPAFWSYQSGSYEKRPAWVLPLKVNFKQDNFLGMNAPDYGGGTPVVDVWRKDIGIGVGHVELVPKLVSLPITMPDAKHATLAVSFKKKETLAHGATLKTFRTFVEVHHGDYFQTLTEYRRVMQKQGFTFQPSPESAYEPVWCAWGFEKKFTPSQIENALPIVKKLGFGWVGVDYGWQTAVGDSSLDPKKFPNGDSDMKALVDKIHAAGFKAQLWWSPLAAEPRSDLARRHPDELLLNADGSTEKISFFHTLYLCPADPRVVEYHRETVKKILADWGYDGLKLDSMHMNAAPPCYNPAHQHARPEESVEAMPPFFKAIFETARSIKPDALVEFCPCGTAYSFYTLPYINMSVASDPEGSWQVRTKRKTLNALQGDGIAYFGDHVELSDGKDDFASTVGVGGVVGTQFTWPAGSALRRAYDLTPGKEKIWEKWIGIYRQKMLSRGEYLGALYDIGFDRPETHAIRKAGNMYYAFYTPEWSGKVELRGLADRVYRVSDYENNKDLGTVRGPTGTLNVQFKRHLLLEARGE